MKIEKRTFKKILRLIGEPEELISAFTDIKGFGNWCKSKKLKTIGFEFNSKIVARKYRLKVKRILLDDRVENFSPLYLGVEGSILYLSVKGLL